MSNSNRKELKARSPVEKQAVVAGKDRTTKRVSAKVVDDVSASTLQGFVAENIKPGTTVYIDDALAYFGLAGMSKSLPDPRTFESG